MYFCNNYGYPLENYCTLNRINSRLLVLEYMKIGMVGKYFEVKR